MSIAIAERIPISWTRRTSQRLPATRNYIKLLLRPTPSSTRIGKRGFSVQPAKMAKIPTEIPSLKLNDGTSIPMVATLTYAIPSAWY